MMAYLNISNDFMYWLKVGKTLLSVTHITLAIYFVTIILSLPLGLLCSLGKISNSKILKKFLGFYTWIFRGTPLLLQLMFTYFGLSAIGIVLTPFQAAALAFVFNYAAYFTEIFRGGIQSIEKGQYEGAKALGMNYKQTMTHVIIPQAIRRVLPPLSNEAITLVKDTALVSVIAMGDIMRTAQELSAKDVSLSPYVIAGIFYLLLTSIVVFIFKKLENKYVI